MPNGHRYQISIESAQARKSAVSLETQLTKDEARSVLGWSDLDADRSSIAATADDLSREVYCILGMPIDAIDMPAVLRSINVAAAGLAPFIISTPNLNFLVNSQRDSEFRESLLLSDLCPTDGMPIVWIARLMGIPIKHRIAGADIFEALKTQPRSEGPLKVFLYGATETVAAAAAATINANSAGLRCVGWLCPGFGTLDELSHDQFIDRINSSNADFLFVALGAKKGQAWIQRNYRRLRIPIRANLGATINFQARAVKRAPYVMQKFGLEWLWRIKEEPYLWRRYWHDGHVLLFLMLTRILPLAVRARSLRRRCVNNGHDLVIERLQNGGHVTLRLSGFAIAEQAEKAISHFRDAVTTRNQIVIDFSETRAIDARLLGLLLMVRKLVKAQGAALTLVGLSRELKKMFRLNGAEYLLGYGESS
jgi:N-acetylglucosaminyldiphosphoundecaprenol N-acetyl-beta-D-mannosaminyltransferase